MIKPSELRIGNWYYMTGLGFSTEYKEQFTVWTEALDFEVYGEPIPLTPDIIKNCDFEMIGFPERNIVVEYHKIDSPHKFKIFSRHRIFRYHEHQYNEVILKSLHQLQNLYFALTGSELNYTP